MSYLGELFMWCSIVGTASAIATIVYGRYKVKAAVELKACVKIPPCDDADRSVKSMVSFICKRMYALGFPGMGSDGFSMLDTFDPDMKREMTKFVKMCHACGCEVVVRQVANYDIEEQSNEVNQVVSEMREDWYAQ